MRGDLWYRNAIVYSLSVETFMDGNGDGCGDFAGLSRRLDYLESLGVDVLWLAPFQPTPEPRRRLRHLRLLRRRPAATGRPATSSSSCTRRGSRGIRVLIDLVVNHTSDRHPWFVEAQRAATRRATTGTCGRRSGRRTGSRGWSSRASRRRRGRATGGARVLLPPLLRLPAGPQHGQPARPRRGPADHGLLARSSASLASASTPSRSSSRSRRPAAGRRSSGSSGCTSSATSSSGASATPSCSARPTSSRARRSSTSPAATGCT